MLIFLTDIKTMEEYTFLAPLLLTIGGLIIGAILKSLLKHSRLPYTVKVTEYFTRDEQKVPDVKISITPVLKR